MKELIIFLFCLGCSMTGFSQTIVIKDLGSLSDQLTYKRSRNNNAENANYSNIEGSPFLHQDFVLGDIVKNDSIRYENIPLRYNIYTDKMEFLNNRKQIMEIDNAEPIYTFSVGKHSFIIHDYLNYGEKTRGILELLVKGQIQLYKKYNVVYKPAEKAIGYKDPEPRRFIRKDDEYLIAAKNQLPEPVGNKKSLLNKLKQFKPDIEKYAKENRLKPKKEADLIKLVRYCNESFKANR